MKKVITTQNQFFVKILYTDRETGEQNIKECFIRCRNISEALVQAGFVVRVDKGAKYEVSEVLEIRKVS